MNILIVVDMQNDFVNGSLGTKEAQAIIPHVVKRIQEAKAAGWTIYVTQDTHFSDYLHTQEGEKLPVKHCLLGTEGWKLNEDVQSALANYPYCLVHKSTFGSDHMIEELLMLTDSNYRFDLECNGQPDTFELIGLCTDICVVSNAILVKTYFPEDRVVVNSACCAGVTPALHEAALKVMQSCQIDVI